MTFTQITLIGNVGRDPELRFTQQGQAVCSFSLAVNRSWTDRQSNERREETTWWKITVWGNQAETVNQYVSKGKQVLVVGSRVKVDTYTGNDGQVRTSLELTADNVRFLGGSGGPGAGAGYDNYPAQAEDDIPF
ncbi:MAG: single-stranded DNA-binding protein [Anaerolineae bacterium]|nr:single-stranded DNA-binding protein [Anaerolineae bacterium]